MTNYPKYNHALKEVEELFNPILEKTKETNIDLKTEVGIMTNGNFNEVLMSISDLHHYIIVSCHKKDDFSIEINNKVILLEDFRKLTETNKFANIVAPYVEEIISTYNKNEEVILKNFEGVDEELIENNKKRKIRNAR